MRLDRFCVYKGEIEMNQKLNGIFSVISTPFTDMLDVDYESLENCVQFALDSNASGVLTTAMSAEFYTLTDEEHYRIVETIAKKLAGRISIVAGIVSDSWQQCVAYAKHAEANGAAAINLTPPYLESTKWGFSWDDTLRFFDEINRSVHIPMFIQNSKLLGCNMNVSQVLELAQRFENVQYVKEEGFDCRQNITSILEAAKKLPEGTFSGVMTGSGHNLIEDFRRGVSGIMITPEGTDYYVDIWNAFHSGDEAKAIAMHRKLTPMIIYEDIYWESLAKYIQKRRGIIKTDAIRATISMFTDTNRQEVERMLRTFEPLLRVRY